jgi:hypothetical protein
MRLQTVREYAITVFGKEVAAAAWLGRISPAVLQGFCIVATACQTPEGFREAMLELHRIHERRLTPPGTRPPRK